LGIMILGTLAGMAAGYFGLTERARFHEDKIKAEEKKDKAIKSQEDAESAEKAALRERGIAIDDKDRAEKKMREAENKQKESEAKATAAEQDKKEAFEAKAKADAERDQALADKDTALTARDAMEKECDEALAKAEVEREAREAAEKRRDIALAAMEAANKELAEFRILNEIAQQVVLFSNRLNGILFPLIDEGDDYFIKGLTDFPKAQTRQEQFQAIRFVRTAKDRYTRAQTDLQKLTSIEKIDLTREIKELAFSVAEENLKSVSIVDEVLSAMLQGSPDEKERLAKYQEARKKKESADLRLVEVCNKWIALVDEYKEGFTKTQRDQIENLKNKIIKDRLGETREK